MQPVLSFAAYLGPSFKLVVINWDCPGYNDSFHVYMDI